MAMQPARFVVDVERGALEGSTSRYEKRLSELAGIYADQEAFGSLLKSSGDSLVYAVEDFRPSAAAGDMIFGVTRMVPGKVGEEYFVTRGHLHAVANRPEIYYGEAGSGLMLLESPEGDSRIVAITRRAVCYVPPYWIHRSVNVGGEDLVMTFAYPADAGQDYDIIARSGGMRTRVVDDGRGGWTAIDNPGYRPRSPADIQGIMATAT